MVISPMKSVKTSIVRLRIVPKTSISSMATGMLLIKSACWRNLIASWWQESGRFWLLINLAYSLLDSESGLCRRGLVVSGMKVDITSISERG